MPPYISQIGDRPCSVYASDMRVRVGPRRQHTYSDLVVACGVVELANDDYLDILLNPTVIIEVLSPSTEAYDRGAKAELYRTLESLQEYVLISQNKTHLECYTRQPDGRWIFTETSLADGQWNYHPLTLLFMQMMCIEG